MSANDPTRDEWNKSVRPGAEHVIARCWREAHRFAFLDCGPPRLNRKGQRDRSTGPETNRSRIRAFYNLRHELSLGLMSGAICEDEVRSRLADSDFGNELRFAASRAEGIQELGRLFVDGGNAVLDSEFQGSILWITTWRE